jgi:hypothetical protein
MVALNFSIVMFCHTNANSESIIKEQRVFLKPIKEVTNVCQTVLKDYDLNCV